LDKKRKKKEKKKKKKNKKGDEKEEDDEEEDEDEGDKGVSATKPNSMWWLVPAPLDDGDGKQLSLNDKKKKEAKEALKKHTVEIAATQSALFATKQVAGKTAGMMGVAAVSVSQCAGHWKADNKNKVEAKQWHSYMAVLHPPSKKLT